jgi:tetratricopeptide (TPR) repeat protein
MIASSPSAKSRRLCAVALAAAVGAVLLYFWVGTIVSVGEWSRSGADYNYNLLVEGFRSGHLTLNKTVPPAFAQLPDPFDPATNLVYRLAPYSLHDLSYYRGKLYLYFGVTPALLLFWPWVALTGHYLLHKYAVVLCYSVGFLLSAGLLRAMGRRYFPEVGAGVTACGALALGLASGMPIIQQRADVCEVPISCAYALQLVTLAALWRALHRPAQAGRWLALGSLAYGLAVGSRPSVLFGGVVLLFPVAAAWQEGRRPAADGTPDRRSGLIRLLTAAALPLLLCGLGLALYNYLRFQNPFEFGEHYQLAGDRQDTAQHFSLHYLWFDFRVYFLEPVHWSSHFPFVRQITSPPPPPGHHVIEDPFGILPCIPFVLCALAAPLAVRGRPSEERATLGRWVAAVALVFANTALVMNIFYGSCSRYEIEFLPLLILLAVIGIFSLERVLSGRRGWRLGVRCAWGALLFYSIGFNLLAAAEHYIIEHYTLAGWLFSLNHPSEAVREYEHVIRLQSDYEEAYDNLGNILLQLGRTDEARDRFESALRLKPDSAEAHHNLANALVKLGRTDDAIAQYQQAERLKPSSPVIHYNLAYTLLQVGRSAEAEVEYREALRLNPGLAAQMYLDLGNFLAQHGRLADALPEYQESLRLNPNDAGARYNLGTVLQQLGRPVEAAAEHREALRLNPNLGRAGQ